MTTGLFVFGYPTSIVVLTRWLPVVRERRIRWFLLHEVAVAAIVTGWILKRDPMSAAINGAWLVIAAAWYAAAGRRARAMPGS